MYLDCDGTEITYGDIVKLAEENNQSAKSPAKPGDFLVLRRIVNTQLTGLFSAYCPAKGYLMTIYPWKVKLASLEERMIYLLEN